MSHNTTQYYAIPYKTGQYDNTLVHAWAQHIENWCPWHTQALRWWSVGGKSGRAHFAWCGVKDFELTLVLTPGFWTSSLDPGVSAWAGGANPSTRVFVAWGQIWLKRHDTDQIIGFCQIWINFHSFFICQSSIQTQGKICLIFLSRRNTDLRPGEEVVGVMVKADGNSSNCNVSLLLLCRPWQWIQSSRFKFYWLIIYLASWDAIEPNSQLLPKICFGSFPDGDDGNDDDDRQV